MDELDVFRGFRAGVAAPSGDAEDRAASRLNDAMRPRGGRPWRVAVAFAVIVGATAVGLFVSTPWKSSPGFLERAQAALTPPADGILHVTWTLTRTSKEFGCTVTVGPNEMWQDFSAPHRYRVIDQNSIPPGAIGRREIACGGTRRTESGGTPEGTLEFVPPNSLRNVCCGYNAAEDPVTMLRRSIANGDAHHEGKTELHGRTVERIRIDPREPFGCEPGNCPPPRPSYVYVDPETFHPVQWETPYGYTIAPPGGGFLLFDTVERNLTYEYLPRTEANLALTDIRAQHPDAKGP